MSKIDSPTTYQLIYATVRQIPKGRVATYGQVAELSGLPRQARLVGYAMHALPQRSSVPWHRVVNAQGKISFRFAADAAAIQKQRLQREGVRINDRGVIDMNQYRWQVD
jgi:methylated-DNA-protein-cysteine methyltransferase-like protein